MSRSTIRFCCFAVWICVCLFARAEAAADSASGARWPLSISAVYFGLLVLAAVVAALAVRMVRHWQ